MQGAEPDLGRDCGWGNTYRSRPSAQSAGQGAKGLAFGLPRFLMEKRLQLRKKFASEVFQHCLPA